MLITPDPWLTLSLYSQTVTSASQVFKSSNAEGDQTITVNAFTFTNTSCGTPNYSITSTLSGFVESTGSTTFKVVMPNPTTLNKQTITLTLAISNANMTSVTKTFSYIVYDCAKNTEITKTINWIMDANSSSRSITLPYTSGLLYVEYCKTYYLQTKLDLAATYTAPPLFMTYTNSNPITDDAKGPIITIASNAISSGGKYTLQKYLTLATNQVVNYTLNMCGIAKPSPVFSFDSTATLRVLKLVNSPAREGCATVNVYTITAGDATCSTMAYAMKSGSTVMTENYGYSQVQGLQWKNASGYSICWNFDKT